MKEEEANLLLNICIEKNYHIYPFDYSDKELVSDVCKGIKRTVTSFPHLRSLLESCIWAVYLPSATHVIMKDEWIIYCGQMPGMLGAMKQIDLGEPNE